MNTAVISINPQGAEGGGPEHAADPGTRRIRARGGSGRAASEVVRAASEAVRAEVKPPGSGR